MCDTGLFAKKKMYEDGKIKSNIFLIIVEILKKFISEEREFYIDAVRYN